VLFREKLELAIARGRRGHAFAVLFLDLDRFKEVNDSLGHAVGDKLLQKAADRLRQTLREDDAVARLGGDEFAIIQPDCKGPESAAALATKVIQAIERPYLIELHNLAIGTSVGIALGPGDGADPEVLLKHADLALYRAKADGRGTFRFFEKEMDEKLQARRLLEVELRDGLSRGELELFYQPVFCLQRELICGFEALVRWNHPVRGMVSPADFIPIAEETGLINQIGEWVLREACTEAAGWPDDISVAVNLSAVQFKGRSLAQLVVHALGAAGLAPERLELEVTESVLLKESDNSVGTLHMLRDIGVRIAMDDFGTGYSSLSYLRLFPFSRIKIDRSFVADITTKPDSAAIHSCHDRACAPARHRRDSRGRGNPGAACHAESGRLHADSGLPHQQAAARRGCPRTRGPAGAKASRFGLSGLGWRAGFRFSPWPGTQHNNG
jgi:diguanylate cyclase (GGDEF)-like protein